MKRMVLCLSMASFILLSCSKSNEVTESGSNSVNTGGNTSTCDTVNMKFAANVQPILAANCYACHGNGLAESGVNLDNYTKVKQQVDNGKLLGVITHASGFPAMPYKRPKLSDCDINKIKDWLTRGAKND
jgi:hypothetical protein